jgi:hypothetical protein
MDSHLSTLAVFIEATAVTCSQLVLLVSFQLSFFSLAASPASTTTACCCTLTSRKGPLPHKCHTCLKVMFNCARQPAAIRPCAMHLILLRSVSRQPSRHCTITWASPACFRSATHAGHLFQADHTTTAAEHYNTADQQRYNKLGRLSHSRGAGAAGAPLEFISALVTRLAPCCGARCMLPRRDTVTLHAATP